MTKWTKQYNNDTGPNDDYFEEWFEVTDGRRIFRCEESEDADFLLSVLAQPEPVFWYRPVGEDGGYEGPIHNASIERVRKLSGAWVPLYPHSQRKEPESVVCVTYKEVADTMNSLWGGTLVKIQIAEEMKNKKLYTTPPQRKPPQFPTMLRKMWSGTEVQEWINENWSKT